MLGEDIIGSVGPGITVLALLTTVLGLPTTLALFFLQQRRLEKVQRQQTYQRLELASNEVFRFAADNAGVLIRYQDMERDACFDFERTIVENSVAESHIYQTLNLFEMAARLRHANFFEDEVFGSWVIWYYEMLGSWYFRHKWVEFRLNYTREMRLVFDEPIDKFDPEMDDEERKRWFFAHVAKVLKCPLVKDWLRTA